MSYDDASGVIAEGDEDEPAAYDENDDDDDDNDAATAVPAGFARAVRLYDLDDDNYAHGANDGDNESGDDVGDLVEVVGRQDIVCGSLDSCMAVHRRSSSLLGDGALEPLGARLATAPLPPSNATAMIVTIETVTRMPARRASALSRGGDVAVAANTRMASRVRATNFSEV